MNVGFELAGEFVSDELRNDCAHFLHELRRLVEVRREPTPDSAAWGPGQFSDPQAPPNPARRSAAVEDDLGRFVEVVVGEPSALRPRDHSEHVDGPARRKVGELEDAVGHTLDHCEVTHRDRPGQVAETEVVAGLAKQMRMCAELAQVDHARKHGRGAVDRLGAFGSCSSGEGINRGLACLTQTGRARSGLAADSMRAAAGGERPPPLSVVCGVGFL